MRRKPLTVLVSARRLHAQEHDAVLGALGSALEGGAAPQEGAPLETLTLTSTQQRPHLLFRSRFHDFCGSDNKQTRQRGVLQARGGHVETPPTCVVVHLLALELEVNGGADNHEDGQRDPPQVFV